jgi:hypothetical protein
MPQLPELFDYDLNTPTEDDWLDERREQLKLSLDQIAAEITVVLKDEGFGFPIFLTVPSSGEATMTIATPLDPSDEDWARATEIVCRLVGARIGSQGLRSRPVPCAASGMPMGAADLYPACGPSGAC